MNRIETSNKWICSDCVHKNHALNNPQDSIWIHYYLFLCRFLVYTILRLCDFFFQFSKLPLHTIQSDF